MGVEHHYRIGLEARQAFSHTRIAGDQVGVLPRTLHASHIFTLHQPRMMRNQGCTNDRSAHEFYR